MGLLKTKKEKNRLKHLRERVSSGHTWAENHARVGFWPFKDYEEKNRPKNLRERASSGHRWAEKHARVGVFGPLQDEKIKNKPKTYASALPAAINGPRSTLA